MLGEQRAAWAGGPLAEGGRSVHEVPLVRVTRLPLIATRSKKKEYKKIKLIQVKYTTAPEVKTPLQVT